MDVKREKGVEECCVLMALTTKNHLLREIERESKLIVGVCSGTGEEVEEELTGYSISE